MFCLIQQDFSAKLPLEQSKPTFSEENSLKVCSFFFFLLLFTDLNLYALTGIVALYILSVTIVIFQGLQFIAETIKSGEIQKPVISRILQNDLDDKPAKTTAPLKARIYRSFPKGISLTPEGCTFR